MITIKENLEILFAQDPNVFIAGDLLWHPIEGNNKLRQAPDAMVVFGRPKGDRGSYHPWEEDNIVPPQKNKSSSKSSLPATAPAKRPSSDAFRISE